MISSKNIKKIITLSLISLTLMACNDNPPNPPVPPNPPLTTDTIEVESVERVAWLTGERAVTNTYTDWALGGTDLGIPFYDDTTDKMYIAFGDSYSGEATHDRIRLDNWRNNLIGVSTDYDLSDGLVWDEFLHKGERPFAKEIVPGNKHDGTEVAKIPTGGIAINGTLYMYYMSVRLWGAAGAWDCSYGGVVKSIDHGETWTFVNDLYWVGMSDAITNTLIKEMTGVSVGKNELDSRFGKHFMQIFPVDGKDGYIYMYGITGGRFDGCKLMRVTPANIEKFEEYEYFLGLNGTEANWSKGKAGLALLNDNDASYVIKDLCGEMSVMYNPYIQSWITIYEQANTKMVMRTAKTPWGVWSAPTTVVTQAKFPVMYGAFMHEKYNQQNGKVMYFFMSHWNDYNTSVMKLTFK